MANTFKKRSRFETTVERRNNLRKCLFSIRSEKPIGIIIIKKKKNVY